MWGLYPARAPSVSRFEPGEPPAACAVAGGLTPACPPPVPRGWPARAARGWSGAVSEKGRYIEAMARDPDIVALLDALNAALTEALAALPEPMHLQFMVAVSRGSPCSGRTIRVEMIARLARAFEAIASGCPEGHDNDRHQGR